ncbi:MAG: GspH/FimT family pseudopilin [Deltaproteobacteria bacterium]|nr:GspH/FimT family pseudopilin [Deltaproteobacteria bacterium]
MTLILGITAVVALPMLSSSLDEARLSAAASEVVTALEFAQLTAATTGRETRVTIGDAQERIDVRQYKTTADLFTGGDLLAAGDVEGGTYAFMQYPLKKGTDYLILLGDEDRFQGVDITTSDFNPPGDNVVFDPLGTPSKGGSVTLALGGRQMVVTLDALTGKVTVTD